MLFIPINATTYKTILPGGDEVEIGGREATAFKPHLKLNRWGGECFIKVGLPTTKKIAPVLEGNKTKWLDKDVEAHFYPLEPRTVTAKDKDGKDVEFGQRELGGFEFEVILKKKPSSNQIVLDIETQGLKFYYQPELTPEEIAEGCMRPDNVVGSYAVYHATRTNMHRGKADAEKYKCGKAFHIYRPKIADADGNWVWGELSIDAGTLTTTIPQDFLDKAVYPIMVDPTFGYDTEGGTTVGLLETRIYWTPTLYSPAQDGQITSMSFYGAEYASSDSGVVSKLGLYDSSGGFVIGTGEISIPDGTTITLLSGDVTAETDVFSANNYYVVWIGNNPTTSYIRIAFDVGDTAYKYKNNTYASGFPATLADASTSASKRDYSIYCTYGVAGGQDYPINTSCSITASPAIAYLAAWDRTISPNLSLSPTIDRDATYTRAVSGSNLSLTVNLVKAFGRSITTSVNLTLAPTVAKTVAWSRATSSNLSLATTVIKGWGRTLATSCGITLAPTVSISKGFNRAISNTLSLATTVTRALTFDRASSSNLTVSPSISRKLDTTRTTATTLALATNIIKSWGRTITSSVNLALSTSVDRAVAYARSSTVNIALTTSVAKAIAWARASSSNVSLTTSVDRELAVNRASSSNLSLAVNIIKSWGRTITTSANLSLSAAISRAVTYSRAVASNLSLTTIVIRVVSYARAVSSNLDLSVSIEVTFTPSISIDYPISITASLSLSPTISRSITITRATSSNVALATTVVKAFGRTIATSTNLTLATTIARVLTYTRATATNISLAAVIARAVTYTRATASNLSLTANVAVSRGWTIATSSALSLTATIVRGLTFGRASSSALSVATSVSRKLDAIRASSSALSLTVTVWVFWDYVILTLSSRVRDFTLHARSFTHTLSARVRDFTLHSGER